MLPDSLTSKHEKEFAQLRSGRLSNPVKNFILLIILGTILVGIVVLVALAKRSDDASTQLRRDLISAGAPWARDLVAQQQSYRTWLQNHGTQTEVLLFERATQGLFKSATSIVRKNSGAQEIGFFSTVYIAMHSGAMRVLFLILSSWRLWVLTIFLGAVWGMRRWRVYTGDDFLGQTGNGRLFYSGIRQGVRDVTASGAPNTQVRGLACPKSVPERVAATSELAQILRSFSAENKTNLGLAAVILHYHDWPAYVTQLEEEGLLERFIDRTTLAENAARLLQSALQLHQFYREHGAEEHPEFDDTAAAGSGEGKIDSAVYAQRMQYAMHRVLTPELREELAKIAPAQIATIVLAYESGKAMAYSFEGGKWIRRSQYPQLTARAILHSVSDFAREYDFDERTTIRRALVYAARQSVFAPVKVPVDLSDTARAARQWVELLMAMPHELQAVADDVELYALICQGHRRWVDLFMNGVMTDNPKIVSGVYASAQANLFLMPVRKLVPLLSSILSAEQLRRLEELVAIVSQKQRLSEMTSDLAIENGERGRTPDYARVYPPLSRDEIEKLGTAHDIPLEELRAWSSLRMVLNSFGWLARRVGDYSVSESSVIFAVMKVDERVPEANQHGLIGASGMVPLRGTRLEEKWGKSWRGRFLQVNKANMAETREDYERLMSGEQDLVTDESSGPSSITAS